MGNDMNVYMVVATNENKVHIALVIFNTGFSVVEATFLEDTMNRKMGAICSCHIPV